MQKIFILGAVMVAGAVAVGLVLMSSERPTHVATFTSEVAELESQLVAIEAQVTAGTLTPAAARATRSQLVERLDAIEAASLAATATTLTPSERQQLLAGLTQLKQILVTYQDTLQVVDEQVSVLAAADQSAPSAPRMTSVRLQAVSVIEKIDEELSSAVGGVVPSEVAETATTTPVETEVSTTTSGSSATSTATTTEVMTEEEMDDSDTAKDDDATVTATSSIELEVTRETATSS